MKHWTGIEIEAARRGLEQASAGILGRMLFEFSRLDVALGLFLAWSGEGHQLERLTRIVGESSFHKKLDFLKELAVGKYSCNAEVQSTYGQWLSDAHAARLVRNDLVHGRWATDPIKKQVINVVGLPTSSDQREKRYTISELRRALNQLKKLQTRLQVLRDQWPV